MSVKYYLCGNSDLKDTRKAKEALDRAKEDFKREGIDYRDITCSGRLYTPLQLFSGFTEHVGLESILRFVSRVVSKARSNLTATS